MVKEFFLWIGLFLAIGIFTIPSLVGFLLPSYLAFVCISCLVNDTLAMFVSV